MGWDWSVTLGVLGRVLGGGTTTIGVIGNMIVIASVRNCMVEKDVRIFVFVMSKGKFLYNLRLDLGQMMTYGLKLY